MGGLNVLHSRYWLQHVLWFISMVCMSMVYRVRKRCTRHTPVLLTSASSHSRTSITSSAAAVSSSSALKSLSSLSPLINRIFPSLWLPKIRWVFVSSSFVMIGSQLAILVMWCRCVLVDNDQAAHVLSLYLHVAIHKLLYILHKH